MARQVRQPRPQDLAERRAASRPRLSSGTRNRHPPSATLKPVTDRFFSPPPCSRTALARRNALTAWVGSVMAVRCAILDDYQNIVLKVADWSTVKGDVEFKVFNQHLGGPDNVIAALKDFEIVVAMRERTGFPQAVIEALPKLKLLITTGMRNASIDTEAAKARGVTVCGTGSFGSPTSGHRHRADARTHPPHRLRECPPACRRRLAEHHRPRPRGHDARHPRSRQARYPHRQHRQGVRHEGHRLEPEPDGGKMRGGRRRLREQGRAVPPVRLHHHPRRAVAAHAAAWSARKNSA